MYTEAMLYAFAHAVRNTDLTTVQIMRRLDHAVGTGVFDDCIWGNMSEQRVADMLRYFMDCCGVSA